MFRSIHIAGIAGSGMSALAQAAKVMGMRVSGSDRLFDSGGGHKWRSFFDEAGIAIRPQTGIGVTQGAEALVLSTAVESSNPDVQAARLAGVPVVHRAELLASLVSGRQLLAVAGTSGKSTVTAMVGSILKASGYNPTIINGAVVVDWANENCAGNFVAGDAALWVAEVDESDRSLLNFEPTYAVITNETADHFDLQATHALFDQFAAKVQNDCFRNIDYNEQISDWKGTVDSSRFCVEGVPFRLRLPGYHNACNALCASMLCRCLNISLSDCAAGLAGFSGVARRLELIGRAKGVVIYDDFGHNPAKIRAAIETLRPHAAGMTLVWRPHGYGPLRQMFDDLLNVFEVLTRQHDHLALLPVYDAGGTATRDIQSDVLADALTRRGVQAEYLGDVARVPEWASDYAVKDGIIMVMGARDPGLPLLARSILSTLRA